MEIRTKTRLRRALWVVLPVLAVGLVALPRAMAWGRHHHRPQNAQELNDHLDHGLEHLLDKIDATDAQRERASAITAQRAPELFAIMSEGRATRQELKQVLLADTLDRARLEAAHQKLNALAARATDVGLSSVAELSEVLTPAQRKQIADRLARFDE